MGRLACFICCAITVIFVGGFTALIVWLVRRDRWHIHVNVVSADLTRFDLEQNQILAYNLTLGARMRNANKATVYYNKLAANAYYGGQEIGAVNVSTFTQWGKSTAMIYPAFQGRSQVSGNSTFLREKGEGSYSIGVKIYMQITIEWETTDEYGSKYTHRKGYAPVADCSLKVPAPVNGTASSGFQPAECSVKW